MQRKYLTKITAMLFCAVICAASLVGCRRIDHDPVNFSVTSAESTAGSVPSGADMSETTSGASSAAGSEKKNAIAEKDPEASVCPAGMPEEPTASTSASPDNGTETPGQQLSEPSARGISMNSLPPYSGEPFVVIGNNVPDFRYADLTEKSYEEYAALDKLGRCGVCIASIGKDLMPTEDRTSIGSVRPTGWQTVKYDNIDGKYLYNRCHLIGFQLTGETTNERNLITGTRYLNIAGMLPFENMVADYVKETGNHVLYRVTPVFKGRDLVASGVHMEGYSVEDDGDGICFNVYCYNVQPGITIDYATGKSTLTGQKPVPSQSSVPVASSTSEKPSASSAASSSSGKSSSSSGTVSSAPSDVKPGETLVWIPTNGGKKYHSKPSCSSMIDPVQVPLSVAEKNGYTPCGRCH